MPDPNLTKLLRQTLVQAARAAVGSTMFRHMYVRNKQTGEKLDTMQDGQYACAFFVSGLLAMLKLIDSSHSVVPTTLERMQEAGWRKIDAPKPGAVAHWAMYEGHEHLGFCVGPDEYISNSFAARVPKAHGPALADGRTPDAYYWHPSLDAE